MIRPDKWSLGPTFYLPLAIVVSLNFLFSVCATEHSIILRRTPATIAPSTTTAMAVDGGGGDAERKDHS